MYMRCPESRLARYRRAFTLVELSIAIAITALVMSAIAAITYATSVQWRTMEGAQSLAVVSTITDARLEQLIRRAKLTGLVRTGGSISGQTTAAACVMFWCADSNNDKAMQFSEMGLLQYDKISESVLFYGVRWPAGWTAAQKASADVIMSSADMTTPTAPEDFKALSYVLPTTVVKKVKAASFCVAGGSSTSERPRLDVVLKLNIGGTTRLRYFSASLRAVNKSPSATPNT